MGTILNVFSRCVGILESTPWAKSLMKG